MTEQSDFQRLIGYVQSFELAQVADAWAVLEPCFAEDAVHITHNAGTMGSESHGRDAVIEGLRRSVLDHDRRFDLRIAEILEGPRTRPDGIWMRYALTLRRAGLPDLRLEGEHLAEYADGRIVRLEEWLPADTPGRIEAFLAEHGDALRPAGSSLATPDPRDLRELEEATARSMVRVYGGAKSEQDIGAALAVCTEDFVLETPAFGTRSVGREETAGQLGVFFSAFPDYDVELEGFAQGDAVVAWGRARLSLRGELLGITPTQKTAELAFYSLFDVANGLIQKERFIFDRAEFCEQLGLPAAALEEARTLLIAAQGGTHG
ncbi:MAG: nuclear transport factor 2 family protein [Deltaproteobacteria bacterium]|nr:nuclear transport factor 2 family protein [Deltaproteobacteria bacterium]MBW2394480.1 nuclear transport factor 2 family protein [Deltaproteobacteria bacterium]